MRPIRFKKKTDKGETRRSFYKILDTIDSCKTSDQLHAAQRMKSNFDKLYKVSCEDYQILCSRIRYKLLLLP